MGDVREFAAGWSISRLADAFQLDRRTVTKRIRDAGIAPTGQRNGHDVYAMAIVAPTLVDLSKCAAGGTLDPRDLPPIDRRAYYQSENERLKVETTVGVLVPAAEVEANYAELIKHVVQFFDTLPDVLERDCNLTAEQVIEAQKTCDAMRQQMYKAITSSAEE